MSELIDFKSYPLSTVLNLLLRDRTTGNNIIFATEAYDGFDFGTAITEDLLMEGMVDIRPRVLKSLEEQTRRTRQSAEVFTPAWICNKMNNHCDAEWFGCENVFNLEQEHEWIPTEDKIEFPDGKSWKDYVDSKRLEITCGEAPYLVSRYDAASGVGIPIQKRIGILDRKLRIINENTQTHKTWNQWVYRAFESVYGYELQGDSLLIARGNLLETFCEYTRDRWGEEPSVSSLKRVADIISWNLWQMNGISGTVPQADAGWEQAAEVPQQLSFFDMAEDTDDMEKAATKYAAKTPNAEYCKIKDWYTDEIITYSGMKRGGKL